MNTLKSMAAIESMNPLGRIKMEDIRDQRDSREDLLSRFRHSTHHELEDREREEIKREFRSREELLENLQRQMAAANALVTGLPTAAHFAGLAASVVSSNTGVLPLNTVTSSANPTSVVPTSTIMSSSSPSGASGSSGPSSSPAIQSIEAGKGYTFEEQFKQV